jgi:hypothetical protein
MQRTMPTASLQNDPRGPFARRFRQSVTEIEAALVRRSVGALGAGRPNCVHCHRTPLVGEAVHVYSTPGGDDVVCELCRPRRTAEPDRTVVVRSPEGAGTVRPVPRAA